MKYTVIKTGSKGNAVLIGNILIDCGVNAKEITPYIDEIDMCYVTHLHKDHISKPAITLLDKNSIPIYTHVKNKRKRKGNVLYELKDKLKNKITYVDTDEVVELEDLSGRSIKLWLGIQVPHDAPNYTVHIEYEDELIWYSTDCGSLKGEVAKDYDYYFIETNYSKKIIYQMIKDTPPNTFCRFRRSLKTHLSLEQAQAFIKANAKKNSVIIPLHQSSILDKKPTFKKGE